SPIHVTQKDIDVVSWPLLVECRTKFLYLRPTFSSLVLFLFKPTSPTQIYTLSLHDALPISCEYARRVRPLRETHGSAERRRAERSEEHTSELQSRSDLVCRLLLEKKKRLSALGLLALRLLVVWFSLDLLSQILRFSFLSLTI